jgi:DNA primase
VAIPQHFVQELLSRVDIVEVVGRYVQLKKGGANFMGLCPFHGEKSPSFSVSPSKQFFHCFGCGKNGNAVGFLMEHTGIGFVEAVKDLAQQVGLQVPEEDIPPQERARAAEQRKKQSTLNEVLQKAGDAYKAQLKASPRAIDYLKRRGLSGQIAKTYGLGYAPEGWRFLSTVFPDYQSTLLVESGLVIAHHTEEASEAAPTTSSEAVEQRRYDRFRDRVMFPIRNVKGECIGFGGRVLDKGEPKYLNSPETPVFSKGQELYGLFEARSAIRQAGYVLVTEGYMDVVALAQLGFGNAVATLGTACTAEHVRLLFRFSDAVVFSFDGDAAGRRAAHKALEAALPWASDTRSVKFLFLPPEHDPDSFVREQGPEAFAQAVKTAQPLSRFLLDAAAAGCDLDTAEGRALMASQAQPLWTAMPDGALKRQLLGELADGVGLDPRELAGLWQSGGQRRSTLPRTRRPADAPPAIDTQRADARPAQVASARPDAPNAWPSQVSATRRPHATRTQRTRAKGLLGRGDRVARIVLSAPQAWDWLTADDHQMLGHEPPPHGPLFAWLESQWHEHGPQPWAALREALRQQDFEPLALELHTGGLALERTHTADAPPDAESPTEQDLRRELRELLRRMHIERLKQRETELVSRAQTDPLTLALYREAQLARRRLENELDEATD